MGAIGIVALVIVVLIVSAIGFQNFLAAIGVAIFFALFLRYLTDEYYKFSEGLSGAIVSLSIAGILSIFIDVGIWGFWIAYIVILLLYGISLNRSFAKAEEEAQPLLKELQYFLEDYAHFMPDYDRRAEVYWEDRKIQIKLWTWDAEIKRDIYRECEREHVDPTAFFFGEYQPISKRDYLFYVLLDEGTPALGKGSFVCICPLASLGRKRRYIFSVLSHRMKEKYSGSFSGNKDMFTIRFDKTK